MKIAVPIIALALLSGCKTNTQATVYTSDALGVAENGTILQTPLTIGFEVVSESKCREVSSTLLEPLQNAFHSAEFIGCERDGIDSFAVYRLTTDIVLLTGDDGHLTEMPLYIGVVNKPSADGENWVDVGFLLNTLKADELIASIPNEVIGYRDPELNAVLSATISNDMASDIVIQASDAFADGQPVTNFKNFTVPRRSEVEIKLSNVSNAAFGEVDAWARIAYIASPRE
ncbi:DUF7424 family protein [Halocynthiibacter namhaensis]|uniref:DUF7424 family protein n=1 Tax=Halocynthiibacter namhaensis TaxID=1290553 RepID=UPI000578F926|nr:hypothetical protein [Halocynthiibacter namhaensis]